MARAFIDEHRPDAVVGLGGYAAGPAVTIAARLGITTAILNPDAIPGRANHYLAKRADRVFCQWGETVEHLPQPALARVPGCPTRDGIDGHDPYAARRALGLEQEKLTLLITGASQGAGTVNAAMPRALERIADRIQRPWQVLHQCGNGRASEVPPLGDAAAGRFDYRVVPFIDDMGEAIAAADLVVCRAGACTLAEITAVGRPCIMLPYPYHRDQHQRHNARILVKVGAGLMEQDARDPEQNAAHLAEPLLELMTDDDRRDRMAGLSKTLGKPRAADTILDDLERLVTSD